MSRAAKPRILVDARMAGAQGHGIGLYVQQMAEGLAALAPQEYELFYLIPPDASRSSPLRTQPHAESKIPFLHKSELLLLAREIRRYSPAFFHTPSFASLLSYPCPHLQTVHDLNHLHFGSATQKAYYRFVLQKSLLQARAVLSVSQAAALEIQIWLGKAGYRDRVQVVPNAIDEFPQADDAPILHRFGLDSGNYFFALSNPKPHKNLEMLERAYARALEKRSLPPLVLSIPGVSPPGIVRTGPLADAEVGALLRNAKAFYFPSLYEGFGRPPLEAALAGTPPVVSSLSVHREVLEGVRETAYLDPADEAQWVDSFLRMANRSERTSAESRNWIRETWSKARLAREMHRVYQVLLSDRSAAPS